MAEIQSPSGGRAEPGREKKDVRGRCRQEPRPGVGARGDREGAAHDGEQRVGNGGARGGASEAERKAARVRGGRGRGASSRGRGRTGSERGQGRTGSERRAGGERAAVAVRTSWAASRLRWR